MQTRILTGLFLILLVSGFIFAGAYSFLLFTLLLNHLGLVEYHRLTTLAGHAVQKQLSHFLGFLLLLLTGLVLLQRISKDALLIFLPLLFAPFVAELFRKKETPFPNAALCLAGLAWISLPLALFLSTGFNPLQQHLYHPALPMGYCVILWSGDSIAYAVGKALGRHKLFPRISPNKTWEGSAGGLAAALLGGFVNAQLFPALSIGQWLLLAVVINVAGTFGDFVKSMLKRSVGVKDAGNLLPGHGGILDRFDSLIGSTPFAVVYLFFFT